MAFSRDQGVGSDALDAGGGNGAAGALARVRGGLIRTIEDEQVRWFLWVPVLFGLGIAIYFALPVEPTLWLPAGLVVGGLLMRWLWRESVASILIGGSLLALALGFAMAKLRAERVAGPILAEQARPLTVSGWIELVEPRPQRGQRVTIRVAEIEGHAASATPVRVRIRLAAEELALQPGAAVRITAVLSPPAGPALPGGFDFGRSAWFQGLGAVGYAREPLQRVAIEKPVPWDLAWRAPIERLRQDIGRRITAALPGETGAIATALITGERGGISDATNEAYRDSGLLHILSISGLHMTIMAGAVFLTVRFLLVLSPAIALRFAVKKLAAAAAALGALGYLLISGASFPTVRSYIMISIMFLAVMLDRPAVALRNVALAALAILVLFPESLIDVGFQMSFAAVTALVAAYEVLRERERRLAAGRTRDPSMLRSAMLFVGGILVSTLIAGLAVAPFAAFHFHKSQQYAMLANLIAIPICNILVMPAALAVLLLMPLGLEAWPLALMGWGIEAMTWCAYRVAALPGAVGRIPEIPVLAFVLMLAGGLWLVLWRTRWRLAGIAGIVAGLLLAPLRSAPDVYVGRDGLVVVRERDGRLSALSPRANAFDLARILEHDGDDRRVDEVAAARAFLCDWSGCVARTQGRLVAVERHPAALADDCPRADVVVTAHAARGVGAVCGRAVVVDAAAVARNGAHAIKFRTDGGAASPDATNGLAGISIATVADRRGVRPWSQPAATVRAGNSWRWVPGRAAGTPRARAATDHQENSGRPADSAAAPGHGRAVGASPRESRPMPPSSPERAGSQSRPKPPNPDEDP